MAQSVLLFGSKGLIGSRLLSLLMDDDFSPVNIFVRKSMGIVHPKLQEHVINFDALLQYKEKIKVDVLFCCLGNTIRKAGSQAAFRKVDFELPVQLSEIAAIN